MNIKPLHNGIFFEFEEDIDRNRNGAFKEVSEAGIITFADRDASTKLGRWATVIAVGNEVVDGDIKPGARICIEPLMWTNDVVVDNKTFWKTDEDKVLAVQLIG